MIATGTRIGQYEILSLVGSGGMGEVYLAMDHTLGRRVAMKFLSPALTHDEEAGRRLVREARAAARLDHPNICAIHEIGESGGRRFIVMPFLEGETLADRLLRGPLAPRDAVSVVVRVATALSAAHACGIVHRDIKPQNIVLTAKGHVKILDFGIAALAPNASGADSETMTRLTTPGAVLGTWPYMSPEQVRGEELDGRSDIFSLGVVLFECVWGFHPFRTASAAEVISNILTRDPLASPEFDGARAPALVPIVRRSLEKERWRRYASADDLAADLERARDRLDTAAAVLPRTAPTGSAVPATRRRAVRRALATGLALLVLAIGAAAVVWKSGPRSAATVAPAAAHSPAYDDYVRGKVKLRTQTRDGIDEAIRLLEHGVAVDPKFAPAVAELARAYTFKAFQFSTGAEQKRLLEDAAVAIEKALALDPNLAEAHLARGRLVWTNARDFPHEMAIRAYRRAIELDPGLDEAHHELGVVYMHIGLLDEASAEVERALTINPDNTLARVRAGTIALYRGDFAESIAQLERVPEEANPSYRSRALAEALFRSGRTRDAEKLADEFLQRNPRDEGGNMTSVKAMVFARDGKRDEAHAAIRRAIETGKTAGHFHHTAYNVGCAYAMLREPADAVHWLDVAARSGFPCYPLFEHDRTLDSLRRDPGFMALLDRLETQWEGFKRLARS